MKINSLLWPMKLHYFLIFAGTAPMLPFLPVYMHENLNLSYTGIGLIYTILPFLGLIFKAVSGALSDWFHIHRSIFLISILVCGFSFFSIHFSPSLELLYNPSGAQVQFDCSSPVSYIRRISPDHECDTSIKKELIASTSSACYLRCGVDIAIMKDVCHSWNANHSNCMGEFSQLSVLVSFNESLDDGKDIFIPISRVLFYDEEVSDPKCFPHHRFDCNARCDDDQLMELWNAPNYVSISIYKSLLSQSAFWVLLVLIGVAWSALAICVVMSDTICFQLLGAEGNKYGRQRLFGSIGWGVSVVFTGFVIDLTSDDLTAKNYTAAFVLTLSFLMIDFLVATRLQVKMEHRTSSGFSLFRTVLSDLKVLLFITCCVVVGISTGVLWTYQVMMVEEVILSWDCNFEYRKLLEGLIIGVSCFGGELPFFFIADFFLEKLGHINAISLVIGVFGLRFILYWTVSNPWLFLPIELLNGFTFGIFYVTMTSYANILAPEGARATMQGLVGAAFEGLGVASGGFIGGMLFNSYGGKNTYFYVGLFNVAFMLFHVVVQKILSRKTSLPITNSSEEDLNVCRALSPLSEVEHKSADLDSL